MLALVVSEFALCFLGFLLRRVDAIIEELQQEALRLLVLVGLQGEEVLDDGLRYHLCLFRRLARRRDLDEVRLLRVLYVEVLLGEVFRLRYLVLILPLHAVDDRLQDRARFHELHVVRRRRVSTAHAQHSCRGCRTAHALTGTRLHERRRLIFLRQYERNDERHQCKPDDDYPQFLLVPGHDACQAPEVDAFFFVLFHSLTPFPPIG